MQQLLGNERVEVQLKLSNGQTKTVGLVMNGATIETVVARSLPNPTLVLKTDEATVTEIMKSTDAYNTFVLKVNQGKLKYEGKSEATKSKLFFVNAVVWFTNLVNAFLHFFVGKT